jgi:hypothetical protein
MSDILGLGVTHFPGLMVPDDKKCFAVFRP